MRHVKAIVRRRFCIGLSLFLCGIAGLGGGLFAADRHPSTQPLPGGVLTWDALGKATNIVAIADAARFVFSFTNVSRGNVVIQGVQPTCGCTTVELSPLPWTLSPGARGQFRFAVNLSLLGKARQQVETVHVATDRGFVDLSLGITVEPPAVPEQPASERRRALKLATADRQAVFRGRCAECHAKPVADIEDGRALYYAVCAVCHENRNHDKTMPDLFAIKTPTDVVFWLNWISRGKPGSLMPAFSKAEGGPLSEMQIAYLARYLNTTDNVDGP